MCSRRPIDQRVSGGSVSHRASLRPSALYLASSIGDGGDDNLVGGGAGWVEVDYGAGGNVEAMTVHSQCGDNGVLACADPGGTLEDRRDALRGNCACAVEQHSLYRWDELNRMAEARRYDYEAGSWVRKVRQRYRYDAANVRTVKQTLDEQEGTAPPQSGLIPRERVALYVYPGDFERRGLVTGFEGYEANVELGTETQYIVAGARTVWKHDGSPSNYDREQRLTVGITDLIQTTAGVIDVRSGALLEASTYYPNGARETYRVDDDVFVDPVTSDTYRTITAPEVAGFTGKEGDEEVGLVYFGERYLIPRLGRWASPDPLHVHAVGGGEVLNSYHYVTGNLFAARDPLGLQCAGGDQDCDYETEVTPPSDAAPQSSWEILDEAPDAAPSHLDDVQWARATVDGRTRYWYWRPLESNERVSGEMGTVPGYWREFQVSGGATATDDTDYAVDAASAGVTLVGRAVVKRLARAVLGEAAEGAVEAGTRRVSREAQEAGVDVVNPGGTSVPGRARNCQNTAICTDATLAGRPATAVPGRGAPPGLYSLPSESQAVQRHYSRLARLRGVDEPVLHNTATSAELIQGIQRLPEGSRVIVLARRADGEAGHAFNAVLGPNGRVTLVDGQIGGATPSLQGYSGFDYFRTDLIDP